MENKLGTEKTQSIRGKRFHQKSVKSFVDKKAMESSDPFSMGNSAGTVRVQTEFASEQGSRGAEIIGLGSGPITTSIVNSTIARKRSRYAVLTNGYAKRAIDILVSNYVGEGHRMISQAPDPDFKREIEELWEDWSHEVDISGKVSLGSFEALAVRSMLEGGDCFIRLRNRRLEDNLTVPLQLQLLESEQVPVTKNQTNGKSSIVGGIEFDALGRILYYHMHKNHPGEFVITNGSKGPQTVPVPARDVIHLHDIRRPGEVRGLPAISAALIQLSDIDKYLDAELVRKKAAALIGGFIRQPPDNISGNPFESIEGYEDEDNEDVHIESLEPGTFPILPPGYDVTFTDPAEVGGSFEMFMRHQLLQISAALNILYEQLTGDVTKVNDRTIRATLLEFKRIASVFQKNVIQHQLYRRVFQRWFGMALLSGALKIPSGMSERQARKVRWVPDPWEFMNPYQEVNTQIAEVRAGFRSRSEVIIAHGGIPEEVDLRVFEDQKRESDFDLVYDTNARLVSKAGGVQSLDAVDISDDSVASNNNFGENNNANSNDD
jgi:lambda family phage portal protein